MRMTCHDSQRFNLDLDLENSLMFNQPLILCAGVDDNVGLLQRITKIKFRS